jgi:hypothetical protein
LPTAELGSRPLFPRAGLAQYLDWTVGAHLDAYSGIYSAAKSDFDHHGFHRIKQSPLGTVSFYPTVAEFQLADSRVLYHYRKLRAARTHDAAPILEQRTQQPGNDTMVTKCVWYFKSLDEQAMQESIDRDRLSAEAREIHRIGIDVFKFVTNESPFPEVMGNMLSLMAGYLHQTEDYVRDLIERRKQWLRPSPRSGSHR